MDTIRSFYLLKEKILEKYKEHYPYYTGNIREFGNKEIAQLIDLIEKDCQERVSEKWVYTHLKPAENTKLPRKDMLDIFSRWIGYKGWDEFVHAVSSQTPVEKNDIKKQSNKKTYAIMGIAAVALAIIAAIGFSGSTEINVYLKDKYTQKEIEGDKIAVYLLGTKKEKLQKKGSCFTINTDTETDLLIESPYYKSDTLHISPNRNTYEFDLQPDDYAMMLRAYMNSDLDNWNKRKQQLESILSDDAVIQEIMFDEIGVEFLDKAEFIRKITTPSKTVKNMEIVAIEYEGDKIISLKYIQK